MVATAALAVVVPDIYQRIKPDPPAPPPPPPLTVVATAPADCPGGAYILPESMLSQLPAWDELDSTWAYAHGGFDYSGEYRLTIEGQSERVTFLQGLRVAAVEVQTMPEDPVKVDKCYGGGDVQPRFFRVTLDGSVPTVESLSGDLDIPGDGGDPAVSFPFTISQTDPEYFHVNVDNRERYLSWQLELDWTSAGVNGTSFVGLDQSRFLTGPQNAKMPSYGFFSGTGKLERRD